MGRYCTQCGWKASDEDLFCGNCGHALSKKAITQEEQSDSSACNGTRNNVYSYYDQLPLSLRADDIAKVLGISRANAYTLMHSKDFPTIFIGKRMLAPKDKFLSWLEKQTS